MGDGLQGARRLLNMFLLIDQVAGRGGQDQNLADVERGIIK
jgi:hypothetical protein